MTHILVLGGACRHHMQIHVVRSRASRPRIFLLYAQLLVVGAFCLDLLLCGSFSGIDRFKEHVTDQAMEHLGPW